MISCHNVKLDAFWAGEWQSTWTLENGKLRGDIMIRSHYFELGNMQFNLDQTFEDINLKDANDAASIVAAIKTVEDKVSQRYITFILCCLVPTKPRRYVY